MGLDPTQVEAWLELCGGEVREVEVRTSRGLRPGLVVSPPPRTTMVIYVIPNTALASAPDGSLLGPGLQPAS